MIPMGTFSLFGDTVRKAVRFHGPAGIPERVCGAGSQRAWAHALVGH